MALLPGFTNLPTLLSVLILLSLSTPAFPLPQEQKPLLAEQHHNEHASSERRPLRGRFLHITDFHPDLLYKPHTSVESGIACHRHHGKAGILGTELSDCDSPFTLINATFQWLKDHVKDDVDFVIWTGDSARHDNDDKVPRTEQEVLELNEFLVDKFTEVFGKKDHGKGPRSTNDYVIPIIPTIGNNDIMPHNIMTQGPNFWTKKFTHIWRHLIPEEQKHSFERGGWFYVEVIPNKLAVFNLNTMYFFCHNAAVDGCAKKSEPGYEQLQWLRIQLQFFRQRGMKAIMIGHVPPAQTANKQAWDGTCWQMYAFWMQQYRDVIVGSMYGHMNIDHFMLQDFHMIKKKTKKGRLKKADLIPIEALDDEISALSSTEYLADLRDSWANIPDIPTSVFESTAEDSGTPLKATTKKRKHKSKKDRSPEDIGGEWAERYSVSLVSASLVPNYFPSFRIIKYNTTGLDSVIDTSPALAPNDRSVDALHNMPRVDGKEHNPLAKPSKTNKKHQKHQKKSSKKKKPRYEVPLPPTTSSPPGPAYSPQTFTFLSYKQFYANLTYINAAFEAASDPIPSSEQYGKGRKHAPQLPEFTFDLEYDTANDSVYSLPDLTVRSWVDLARRIGKYDPDESLLVAESNAHANKKDKQRKRKSHKKQKEKERKETERLWFTFVRRAYVGAKEDEQLRDEFEGV